MSPLVSILIPCFNAERWLGQAIESALDQTGPQKEVIVVDDGSTDGSLEIIKRFDERIRFETGPNYGPNVARNRLLELARGDWLQYLDADDYLLPDKINRQVEFIGTNLDTDVVFGPGTMEYWNDGKPRRELFPIPEPHDLWILLARWYLPQTGACLWRKQAIVDVGNWKSDQPCCQEHELYLRLLMAGKRFGYCEHNGAIYRHWGEHTICKRDKPEVRRQRLEIERRAETFLQERHELSSARLWAINQARFEMARVAWQHDREEASGIVRIIQRSQPEFAPSGKAAPPGYGFAYRRLGFRSAETIADLRRYFIPPPSRTG